MFVWRGQVCYYQLWTENDHGTLYGLYLRSYSQQRQECHQHHIRDQADGCADYNAGDLECTLATVR